MVIVAEPAIGSQFLPDGEVQFAPGSIVWRDDECVLRRSGIHSSNGADSFLPVRDFLNAPLLPEFDQRRSAPASRQQLDRRFEGRVFLANDLVELRGAHPGFLQLLKWTACLDTLMLARVPDQQYAILGAEPVKKVFYLASAGETRFIHEVKASLCCAVVRLR